MPSLKTKLALLSSATAAVLLYAPATHAQSADAETSASQGERNGREQPAAQDEIVVTAQQREQRLVDVPVPVTAFSGELLDTYRVQGMGELSLYTPGLLVQEQSVQRSGFNLRGITQDDSSPVTEPTISIFVDGVDNSRVGGAISEILDVERIQVVRGPQGTLFGRGSVIGVISAETNRPTGKWEGRVSAEVGSLDLFNVSAVLNAPIAGDTVAVRTAWRLKRREGDVVNTAIPGGRLNGINTIFGRTALRVAPAAGIISDLIFTYQEDHPPATQFKSIVVPPAGGDLSPFTASAQDRPDAGIDRTVYALTWDNRLDLAEQLDLRSITGYRNVVADEHWDADGTAYAYIIGDQHTQHEQYSEELRLTWTPDASFAVVAGGSWFHERVADTISLGINEQYQLGSFPTYANPTRPIVAATTSNGQPVTPLNYGSLSRENRRTSWSGYINASKTLFDRLTIDVGLRYTRDEATTYASATHRTAGNIPAITIPAGQFGDSGGVVSRKDATFSYWTPRGVVSFKITPDLNVYAGVARGTRSGVIDATYPRTAIHAVPNWNVVAPEEVINYEAGIKARVGRLNADLTFYRYDYTNLQVRDVTFFAGNISSAGKAKGEGVEASVQGELLPGLNVVASYAYNDSGYTYYITPAGANLTGNQFRLSAKHKASFALNYERSIAGSLKGRVRATQFYQSRTFFNADNLPYESQAPYGLTNVGIGVADEDRGWSVEAYVNNLFDQNYLLDLGNTGKTFGLPTSIRGEPRLAGIRFQQDF